MMNSDFDDIEQAEATGYMVQILWGEAYDIYKKLENEYGQTKKDNLLIGRKNNSINAQEPNYGNLDILLDYLSPHSELAEDQDYANPSEEELKKFVRIIESNNISNQQEFRKTFYEIGRLKSEMEEQREKFLNSEFLKNFWELEFDINID